MACCGRRRGRRPSSEVVPIRWTGIGGRQERLLRVSSSRSMAPTLCVLAIMAGLHAEIAKLKRFDVAHLDYQLSVRHIVEGVRILLPTRPGNSRRSAAISHTASSRAERRSS